MEEEKKVIRLDDKYWIESDTLQFTLNYKENIGLNEKTGKDTIREDKWYHPSLASALKNYCNQQYKECGSVGELIQKIDMLEESIDNIFKK